MIEDNTIVPPKQTLIEGGRYGGKPMRLLGMNHKFFQQETKFEAKRIFDSVLTVNDVRL